MALTYKFRRWLDHILKNDVYALENGEIICGRGKRPNHRLKIQKLTSWQIFPEMGFDLVILKLNDGQQLRWCDKYDDLIEILRSAAGDREIRETI